MAATSLAVYTPDKQREVVELMGFKGTPQQTSLLFQLAEHYQLDPLTKEISLIPGKGPFIGVWGRLHIAHRSGKLDGLEMDDEFETDKHYCARVVVWRKDQGRPAAKVIGRVGKHERKDWPLEIARARGLRAALGFAFSIHDAYDQGDEDDVWVPGPDERVDANGTVIAEATEEVTPAPATAAPKQARKVNKKTGEVVDLPGPAEQTSEVGEPAGTGETSASVTPSRPDPAPDTEPATKIVGGHSLAQKIAIAARNAGIDGDEVRHHIIQAASKGTYQRGTDIPEDGYDPDAVDRIFEAFAGLADSTVELRYDPDGKPLLFRIRRS